jgi:hypothetical protein
MLARLAVGEQRTVRLVVPDLGFGDAYFSLSAEGRDLASADEDAGPEVRLQVRRGSRTYARTITFRRAGKGDARARLQLW